MGAQFGITLKGQDSLRGALASIKELKGNPRPALKRFGERMKGWTVDALRKRQNPANGAAHTPLSPLSERLKSEGVRKTRYRLLNSIASRPPTVTKNSVSIGSNLVYANIHQEGGTVRPTRTKYLALPLTKKAARAGSARRFWQQNKGDGPFVKTSKHGNKIIVLRSKRGGLEAHFLLLREVTIPARPYMGFPPNAEQMLVRDFEAYAKVLANSARGGGE